ncbi:MAG: cyclophilin-like fold protein [Planctomycetota bacterium]|jgi:hypothetical protein
MNTIRIKAGEVVVRAELNDSQTARAILDALPFSSSAKLWGREVYFDIPVEAGEENAQAEVPSGAVAYWPPGKALCLFFGEKPYSSVNPVGRIEGDPNVLEVVSEGDPIRVEIGGHTE